MVTKGSPAFYFRNQYGTISKNPNPVKLSKEVKERLDTFRILYGKEHQVFVSLNTAVGLLLDSYNELQEKRNILQEIRNLTFK